MSKPRIQTLIWIAAALLIVFLGLQFVRPAIGNPPVTADLEAPPQVKQILRNSCYNCHSNETKLAWFDRIVPAYWLVASDVKEARMHLNFSEIGARPAGEQKGILYEAVNQVQLGAMPLPSYRRVHPDAVVGPSQLAVLRAYLNPPAPWIAASPADVAASGAQYAAWIAAGNHPAQASAALNGIEFPSDYKNWTPISSTDRFDNQTLRQVLGNGIAIKAVAEHHINPWPDGSTFAKVAWKQQPAEEGAVRTGAFIQVEFMIKDASKYAATAGWGWARWRGVDLKPYGKDADFTAECVGCHRPVRADDFVYTLPIGPNAVAALTGDLPANPLLWKVITSAVNKQDSSMSTLFGNDIAVEYARNNGQQNYPAGSVLSLVTWAQREDPHWFGASIPAAPKSVEFVTVSVGANHRPSFSYQNFEGTPLKKVSAQEGPMPSQRAAYLLAQRAAVMP
jgi:hypothetical protein